MKKNKTIFAITLLCTLYNAHGMQNVSPNPQEKAYQLGCEMLENPSKSYELMYLFLQENQHEIHVIDPKTGNTPLHENVIEACWADKPARLLSITALLACGADRHKKNIEGFSPVECAEEAGNKVVLELLNQEKPTKETLLAIVKKYKIDSLKPMLMESE